MADCVALLLWQPIVVFEIMFGLHETVYAIICEIFVAV